MVATWHTAVAADTQMACGTAAGTYPLTAVDTATFPASLEHQAICAGLLPGTLYFVQVSSTGNTGTSTATGSIMTLPTAVTTPITGVSYSAFSSFNALGLCKMSGDTFYNARAADGRDYFTTDDTSGYSNCGYPTSTSNMQLDVFDGPFPTSAHTVNDLPGFGGGGDSTAPDNNSQKDSGLFAMAGNLFMATGHQLNPNHCCTGRYLPGSPFYQGFGEIKMSPDFGLTWNNWQSVDTFTHAGHPPTEALFGSATPSPFATATFVMYGPDDGTLGYLQAINRHDNADAYVYLVANEGCWNNCNVYYLARVVRARLARLQPGDFQYFMGGDGNLDANWASGLASAVPILTAAGQLSEPNVQYIAALNRYIMLGFYYPEFASYNAAHTVWPVWEAPHPWGPWTLVSSRDWPTEGWYNPVILNSSVWTGTTPTILTTGDFLGSNYNMWYSVMTIEH